MIPSAPQTVRNNFAEELRNVADEDRYKSVERYYRAFQEHNPDDLASYRNIDDRVDKTRYFYFPTEASPLEMNCFEKSASMYFALKELYPQSQPALVYLFQDDGSIHAAALFRHNGELHAADPNSDIFGKIYLMPDALVYMDPEGEEQRVPFSDLVEIDEHTLNQMAIRLRRNKGIIDFIYKSGQRVADGGLIGLGDYLFMSINENQKIISEIRMRRHCLRFVYDPLQKQSNMSFLQYEEEGWRTLRGEQQIIIPSINPYDISDLEDKLHYPPEGIAYYIQHVMQKPFPMNEIRHFMEHPNVRGRFDDVIQEAKKFSPDTYINFFNYLRFKFGAPELLTTFKQGELDTIRRTETDSTIKLIEKNLKRPGLEEFTPALERLKEQIIRSEKIAYKLEFSLERSHLSEVLLVLQLTSDAGRYTQEVSTQIIN